MTVTMAGENILEVIDDTLHSIAVVMEDWPRVDKSTKPKFSDRVEKLKGWKLVLEKWKQEFTTASPDKRNALLFEIHETLGR